MMGRGRPRGSGYDDRQRIEAVTRLMRTGLSRRAAILRLCGPDQLRRIEMKMRIAAMTDAANQKLDAIVRATMRGMGLTDEQIAGVRLEPVGYYTVEGLAYMAEQAKDLGFRMVYRSPEPGPDKA